MTTELALLGGVILLGLVHLVATVPCIILHYGHKYAFGPRDEEQRMSGLGGRLVRAYRNFLESAPLFVAAVLLSHAAGREGSIGVFGAYLYFCARLVYIPGYVAGIAALRTGAWIASIVGIFLILGNAFAITG